MSRKPLTTIDWMQKNVDDIFAGPLGEIESSDSVHDSNVHHKIEQFERKARLNFNKSRPAPPPPGTQILLPKIGNYKPKILLSRNNSKAAAPKSPYDDVQFANPNETENRLLHEQPKSHEQTTERKSSSSESNSKCNIQTDEHGIYSTIDIMPDYDTNITETVERKCMIIGDKDTPLVLESSYIGDDNDNENKTETQEVDNSVSIVPKNELEEDNLFGDHDKVVNVGEVVVNPIFEDKTKQTGESVDIVNEKPRHPYKKRRAPGIPSSYVTRSRHNSQASHDSDEEYPYIPEPDYEEEEATMNFDDVLKKDVYHAQRRDQKIMKEYEGEDFAKYMDEDEGFHDHTLTWRKNIRHNRKPAAHPPNSKHASRSTMQAPKLRPMKKPKNVETQHGSMKRQTLRTISYADCKMGVDDRTIRSVKSTSAGGRYIKRGKERTMIVDGGTGDGGYEEFLRMRHKDEGSLESNSSGDSGHETGDDLYQQEQFFHQMQPKQLREKQGKGTLWEKLTWRFKRHNYRMS